VVEQDPGRDPEEHWEQRLALPVILAALASVPAVFLTLLDSPYDTVGNVVNWLSGAVLVAETVVLFAVSRDKREWIRRHKWLLLLTVAVIFGVVFAIGPVQLLRLLRVFGALRLVRAGRIVKAARIMRDKFGLTGQWSKVAYAAAALLVAAFVGVVLADPTSRSRELLDRWVGGTSQVVLSVLAGAVLAVATFLVVRRQQRNRSE
jgi:CsoR family transcriptional regulator, copper-sensing transcriptional repressor